MASTRDIRRRIKSVKNTQQITKAMKMVAAAKMRRAQEKVQEARPYAAKIEEVVASVAKSSGGKHPMLVSRPVKKTGYIVLTADRGLAGSFNAQVIRLAVNELANKSRDQYSLITIGRRGRDFFKKREYPMSGEVVGLPDFPNFADIKAISEMVVNLYQDEVFDEVYLLYNEFINPIQQVPVMKKLLPLEDLAKSEQKEASYVPGGSSNKENTGYKPSYEFEPSAEAVLDKLLPKFAETLIYSALLESKASEQGARMTAMGNATDNASDMIDSLTLALNRARQSAITLQIMEIVGGAEALNS
ncbi:F0F1 ATP synthase subunit gamma [Fodinisporobacter ferrooxydans]|uniref:ATP synthase gamma chain n=1 Tax=Fodinisporobacter ferrooxydans TaxID=2901836 RepID=A0ABY4CM88_9BACL|nr:F0F1 ATP synthase subunit gamma [Alicyclobacillaceae bacterium MYW30-H2]